MPWQGPEFTTPRRQRQAPPPPRRSCVAGGGVGIVTGLPVAGASRPRVAPGSPGAMLSQFCRALHRPRGRRRCEVGSCVRAMCRPRLSRKLAAASPADLCGGGTPPPRGSCVAGGGVGIVAGLPVAGASRPRVATRVRGARLSQFCRAPHRPRGRRWCEVVLKDLTMCRLRRSRKQAAFAPADLCGGGTPPPRGGCHGGSGIVGVSSAGRVGFSCRVGGAVGFGRER